jgi:hypothetical protein
MGCVFSFGTRWGSSQSIFFCSPLFFLFFLVLGRFPLGPNLTHSYPTHLPTFINIVPTLLPYLLSLTEIATLDLTTILITYPTNLATLLITYLTNLTIVLTTYPTNLTTLTTLLTQVIYKPNHLDKVTCFLCINLFIYLTTLLV